MNEANHTLKSLREALCEQQTQANWPPSIESAVEVLIHMIDRHRPLGPDCKHAQRHTPTCGCEDGTNPWREDRP